MARINKANNDGSISIIIPKSITKINNWEAGQNVEIIANNSSCVLLQNADTEHKFSKVESTEELFKIINESIDKLNEMYGMLKQTPSLSIFQDEESFRDMLRQYLLGLIERI